MRFGLAAACLGLVGFVAVPLGGCKDDDPASASASDSASGTDTATDSDTDSGGSDTGLPGTCSMDADCDDGNTCRVGACGDDGMCTFSPVHTAECRPQIDVEYPPRGATIEQADSIVTVVGTVTSGAGPIESLTLNGMAVDVGANGSFSVDYDATQGGNTLIFETEDIATATRRRVQAFLWSTAFDKPTMPMEGAATEGIGLFLDQHALDDDAPGMPVDDLASLLNLALQGFDITSFFDSGTSIASSAGYEVYLTGLTVGSTSVDLEGVDGGIAVSASLLDIVGTLDFDCTNFGCELAGGDGSGGLTIDGIVVNGNLMLMVTPDNELDVDLTNVTANIDDLNIYSDNIWTNFLLSIIEPFIIDGIVSDLENELIMQIEDNLGPLLADTLSGLSLATSLELPSLAGPDPIVVALETDFGATDFHDGAQPPTPSPPQGGVIELRGGGYAAAPSTPYDNLGVPRRENCGAGGPGLAMPRAGDLEIGLSDDMLNQILYGAWNGGILEFPFGDGIGGGQGGIINDLVVDVSGMLAPTASNCGSDGRFLTHIGDIRIDASLVLVDQPIDFVAHSTMQVVLEVTAEDGVIGIGFSGVDSVETELTVVQDSAIEVEPTLIEVLESELVGGLLEGLGGGSLGGIELPVIDLSERLGLAAGTAVIAIEVINLERVEGTTLITGQFAPPPPMP